MLETIRTWTVPECGQREEKNYTVNSKNGKYGFNYLMDWTTPAIENTSDPDEDKNYYYIQSSAVVAGKYIICAEFCGYSDYTIRLATYDLVTFKRIAVKYITGTEGNDPMFYDNNNRILYLQFSGGVHVTRGFAVDETTGIIGSEVYNEAWSAYYSGIARVGGIWYGIKNGDPYKLFKNIDGDAEVMEGALDIPHFDTSQYYNTTAPHSRLAQPYQAMTVDGEGNLIIGMGYPNKIVRVSITGDEVKVLDYYPIGVSIAGRPIGELESITYDNVNDRWLFVGQYYYEKEKVSPAINKGLYYHCIFEMGDKVTENRPVEYFGYESRTHFNAVAYEKVIYVGHEAEDNIVRHTGEIELPFQTLTSAAAYAQWLVNNTMISSVTIAVKDDITDVAYLSYVYGDATIKMMDGGKLGHVVVHDGSVAGFVNASNSSQTSNIDQIEIGENCKVRVGTECTAIKVGRSSIVSIDRVGACDINANSAILEIYDTRAASGTSTVYTGEVSYSLVTYENAAVIAGVNITHKLLVY